jgi:hypothetical protein
MDFCQNYKRVAWHDAGGTTLLTRLRCKQWACPYCARANQKMWRAFLSGQLPIVSDDWWHVTLTAHSRMRSPDASYKNLQHGIDVIMKRVRRVFGKVEYVRVFEKHPSSDALHAHLAVSALTPFVVPGCHKNLQRGFLSITARSSGDGSWAVRTWLKKTAQECHIGYQADVRAASGESTIWYITKYLTKAQGGINIKGLRHVATSTRIGSPDRSGDRLWSVGNVITSMDVPRGMPIRDLQTGETIPYSKLVQMGIYPDPDPENLTNGL